MKENFVKCMGEDAANASCRSARLVMNSFRFSVLFVVVFNYIKVVSVVFISSNCSFNVHANIKASGSHSMIEKSDFGF